MQRPASTQQLGLLLPTLSEGPRLACMTFDPVLGSALGFCDLSLPHLLSNAFDFIRDRRVNRRANDCQPHVGFDVVLWQVTIAIQIGQLHFCLPHSTHI